MMHSSSERGDANKCWRKKAVQVWINITPAYILFQMPVEHKIVKRIHRIPVKIQFNIPETCSVSYINNNTHLMEIEKKKKGNCV